MRDRLPATYVGLMSTHTLRLTGNSLHDAAMSVAKSYYRNYKLTFPPLNKPLLLLRYLREMAVPRRLQVREMW
jgi:RNA polymerase I-specific transcription initiation factor RRN7